MTEKRRPTVKDTVTLPLFGPKPYVSPDCSKIVFLKGIPNLKTNGLDVEGYVYDIESKTTHRLFVGNRNIKWLDSDSICCLKSVHSSETMQIHVYRDLVGDPIQITNHHPFKVSNRLEMDLFLRPQEENPIPTLELAISSISKMKNLTKDYSM